MRGPPRRAARTTSWTHACAPPRSRPPAPAAATRRTPRVGLTSNSTVQPHTPSAELHLNVCSQCGSARRESVTLETLIARSSQRRGGGGNQPTRPLGIACVSECRHLGATKGFRIGAGAWVCPLCAPSHLARALARAVSHFWQPSSWAIGVIERAQPLCGSSRGAESRGRNMKNGRVKERGKRIKETQGALATRKPMW